MKIHILTLLLFSTICFSQNKTDYNIYNLKGTGFISIPKSLEKQEGENKKISEKVQKITGNDVSEDRIVFQIKGKNKSFRDKTASYEKLIFETKIDKIGDYQKINSNKLATQNELKELGNSYKTQIENASSTINVKLISWNGAKKIKINKRNAIKISYVRKINENEPSVVDIFFFQNNDRLHKITISYRVSKSTEWKMIFENVINSFTITNEI